MIRNLTDFELDVLRKLLNGEAVALSSQLRLRLELSGVIRDGSKGIVVTAEGRRLASESRNPVTAWEGAVRDPSLPKDKRGRRMPFQRKSVF